MYDIQGEERKQRVKSVIDEINLVIIARDEQIKQETIGEMLFSEKWVEKLRYWLRRQFHSNVVRGNFKSNLPVRKKIMDGIKAEEENDLIKRANLTWLKKQIGNIIESYKET